METKNKCLKDPCIRRLMFSQVDQTISTLLTLRTVTYYVAMKVIIA